MGENTDTKYGHLIEDHEWAEDEDETTAPERTSVTDHTVEVIYDTEPDPEDNYSRTKYKAIVRYDRETGDPYVLYVIEHRWKGNYWRDITDLDWRDTPRLVREQVAAVLAVDSPDDLDSGARLMDEGGESRWEKYHKPRVENADGDEMWASSSLRDAHKRLGAAAEQLGDDHDATERVETLVGEVRETIRDLDPTPEGESDGE